MRGARGHGPSPPPGPTQLIPAVSLSKTTHDGLYRRESQSDPRCRAPCELSLARLPALRVRLRLRLVYWPVRVESADRSPEPGCAEIPAMTMAPPPTARVFEGWAGHASRTVIRRPLETGFVPLSTAPHVARSKIDLRRYLPTRRGRDRRMRRDMQRFAGQETRKDGGSLRNAPYRPPGGAIGICAARRGGGEPCAACAARAREANAPRDHGASAGRHTGGSRPCAARLTHCVC